MAILATLVGCTRKKGTLVGPEEPVQTKVRGVWMWGATLYDQGSETVVQKLSENYVSDVFLLVKGISGTKTPAATLKEFISMAHTQGIKVHFWYIVGADQVFLDEHPNAAIYHCPKPSLGRTEPYPISDGRINLLYPGYKRFVLDNLRYFLTNFDCDGVHLDMIRYSHFVYSFDQFHLAKAESLGCNTDRLLKFFVNDYDRYAYNQGFVDLYVNHDSDVVKWVEMRKEIVRGYVEATRKLVDEVKPGIALSAALMPEGATDKEWADANYAQNYADLSNLLDLIAPMAYFKDYQEPITWVGEVTSKALSLVGDECKVATGVQGYNGVSAEEIADQIDAAMTAGSFGVVIFRYGSLTASQWGVVKERFKGMTQ